MSTGAPRCVFKDCRIEPDWVVRLKVRPCGCTDGDGLSHLVCDQHLKLRLDKLGKCAHCGQPYQLYERLISVERL